MLNGVKKADRIEKTIAGVLNHSEELQEFLSGVLKQYFKDHRYTEEDLMRVWELKEDA